MIPSFFQKGRAFDKDSGEIVWETQLPFGGYSIPAAHAVDGRQYFIIPATGGHESKLFRFMLKHSFLILVIICLLVLAQAYLLKWMIPVY